VKKWRLRPLDYDSSEFLKFIEKYLAAENGPEKMQVLIDFGQIDGNFVKILVDEEEKID